MIDRTPFRWKVACQSEQGETREHTISAYWSPEKEGTKEAIEMAAAVELTRASGTVKWSGLVATLLT